MQCIANNCVCGNQEGTEGHGYREMYLPLYVFSENSE